MQAIGEKGENLLVDQLRRPKDIYAGKRKRLGSGGNGIVPGSNETIDSHCSLLRFSETSVTPPGYRASLSFRGEVDIYYLCIITRTNAEDAGAVRAGSAEGERFPVRFELTRG